MNKGFTIICDNCGEKCHSKHSKSKDSTIHRETYERYFNSGDYEITFECTCGNRSVLGEDD